MTLTTILSNIRENVVVVSSETEGRLVGWVQRAQRKAEGAFAWINGAAELTKATTAGSNTLQDAPALLLWPVGKPWYVSGALGSHIPMEWTPSLNDRAKEYIDSTNSDYRGAPRSLMLTLATSSVPGAIEVYPKPGLQNTLGDFSAAGEYEIHMPYHSRGALLSVAGTQTNYLTRNEDLATYIEEFASGKAMLFNHDYDNGNIMLLQAKATLAEAKKIEKARKVPVLEWVPRRDVGASRRQRRAV